MKFKLIFKIYLILGLILAINLVSLPMLQAETLEPLKLTQITISPGENSVKVNWSTNYPGWGRINFGPTPEHGSWIETTQNEARHEMWLSGLNVDQKYYFQINAYDIYGRPFISGNYEFTTRKENDTTSPALYNINTSYVTGNTATFVWQTNEPANTCVFYGLSMANLDQNKCDNHRTNVHDLTVTKLIRNTTYYYRVYSKDKAGNEVLSVFMNFQTNMINDIDIPYLKIYQVTYTAENNESQSTATISLQTSRPVEGQLKWGDQPGKYKHGISLPAPRSTNNQIVIGGLEPNKKYYYTLDIKDIFNHRIVTPEYVFITPSPDLVISAMNLNNDYNLNSPHQDFDADGLTNSLEQIYGTDSVRADTDGDGYLDGEEVKNGYNPLGPGKLNPKFKIFAYNKPRVRNLQTEVNSANELKYELEQLFGGPIPVAKSGWPTLVNSYLYGDYPVEAIYKAIIYSGKTVHPVIPWNAWQSSTDYQEYINS